MLDDLRFDNSFIDSLPADPEERNIRRQVSGAAYSRVAPTPVVQPRLLAWSPELGEVLGITEADARSPEFAEVFAGNRLLPGMQTYAACYGGHQFGNWAGQLGDGRAIGLGEVRTADGGRQELQLKGAGPTPYSRTADGRAVLRSSVREFLCSEAMHHLGVPTTRALSLVATGEEVVRDMFYDGNPEAEPGAVVCRVAPTFLRFGNFELPASRSDVELLRALADYTISTHFPELGRPCPQTYVDWFTEVARRTVAMIVGWMRVGFVHGVMNTDNMSVLGLTIDYGPYGWLEDFDPDWTPNTTDAQGRRYRYGYQPPIALWNLARFGSALAAITDGTDGLQAALDGARADMNASLEHMMRTKLGLAPDKTDDGVAEALPAVLRATETDMTIFFRNLADIDQSEEDDEKLIAPLAEAYYRPETRHADHTERTAAWVRHWLAVAAGQGIHAQQRKARMDSVNPKYVLRNYLAQLAIDRAAGGDSSRILEQLDVLRRPYEVQPGREEFAARRPEWARHRPGCSMLSCSS